jgi:hypothetical protein
MKCITPIFAARQDNWVACEPKENRHFKNISSKPARCSLVEHHMQQNRPAAVSAFVGVFLNGLAVFFLAPIEFPYMPGHLDQWLGSCRLHPAATANSAWAFTIGLVALSVFCVGLIHSSQHFPKAVWIVCGASLFAFGALLDAAGTLLPMAIEHVNDINIGRTLLLATLYLDSAFNGLLGAGILCISFGLPIAHVWLRRFGYLTGLISMPVLFQFHSDDFASLLKIAGPLWLTWVIWVGVMLLRAPVKVPSP